MKRQRIPFLVALLAFSVSGVIPEASAQECDPPETKPPLRSSIDFIYNNDEVLVGLVLGFRDTGSGICEVQQVKAVNFTPDPDAYKPIKGISLHLVSGTKNDLTKPATIVVRIIDCCNNSAEFDPVLTSVIRATGKPVVDTFTDIPQAEGFITLVNGTPGLRRLVAIVNGERFAVQGLKDGEELTIDATSAMKAGSQNTISLVGYGKPGGSAAVLIWEGD